MKKQLNKIVFALLLGIIILPANIYAKDKTDEEDSKAVNVSDVDLSDIEIGDSFTTESGSVYTVVEDDIDNIYIDDEQNKNINHFEITTTVGNNNITWRKFVNLKDLCDETDICEMIVQEVKKKYEEVEDIEDVDYDSELYMARKYKNKIKDEDSERNAYYVTKHVVGSTEFNSMFFVSNKYGESPFKEDEYNGENEEDVGRYYLFNQDDYGLDFGFDDKGNMEADVETLIDENGEVYISLRFVSLALGARVDWIPNDDEDDADDVYIRFYDSENYCKGLKFDFTQKESDSNGDHFVPLSYDEWYNNFLNAAQSNSYSSEFKLNYTYYDDASGTFEEEDDVSVSDLFLGGPAVAVGRYGNTNNKIIEWDILDEEWLGIYILNQPDNEKKLGIFQTSCPNNYDSSGNLKNFDDCLDLTMIVMYYGVPIPINLLDTEYVEKTSCSTDDMDDPFEESNYDSNSNDDDDDSDEDTFTYLIGDTHISNVKSVINDDFDYNNIKYKRVSDATNLKKQLNNIDDSDNNYDIIINLGIDKINDIYISNLDESEKKDKVVEFANEIAEVISKYVKKEYENITIHYIEIPQVSTDDEEDVTLKELVDLYNDEISDSLDNLDKYNFDFCNVEISKNKYKYDSNSLFEYKDTTYSSIIEDIVDNNSCGLNVNN